MSKRKSTGGGSGSADAGAVKVADASMLDAIEQHLKKTMQQILSKRSGTKDEKAALQAMLETMRAGIMEATRAHTEVDDEDAEIEPLDKALAKQVAGLDREVERLAEAVKEAREVHRQALPDAIGKHYKAKMAGVAKAVIPPSAKATSEATEAAVASGAAASAASAASASSSAGGAGGAGGGSRSRRASRGGAGVGAGMPLRPRASTSLAEASALLKPDVRIASFDDQAKILKEQAAEVAECFSTQVGVVGKVAQDVSDAVRVAEDRRRGVYGGSKVDKALAATTGIGASKGSK